MASTVWRGHLAFGLVSFPVRLFRAARAEKVSFRRLYRPSAPPPGSAPSPGRRTLEENLEASLAPPPPASKSAPPPSAPVRQRDVEPAPAPEPPQTPVFRTHNTVTVDADADEEPVSRAELVKGYEYEKGQYVVLEDEELRSITPQTSKEMEIVEFVRMAEIDPIFLETSYYVAPDEAGERPYSLLFEALKETGYVGLAQLAMHSREHIVILRPGSTGLIAHTMFYPDEVRKTQEFRSDTSSINARELDLAKRLIETMVTPFEPDKFRDTYRERLEQIIAAKVEGKRVSREPAAAKRSGAVIDIMQALQESLRMVKKPAATAAPAPARKRSAKKAS